MTIKRDGRRAFAFITFKHEESVPYAEAIMENVFLFNRPLRLAARGSYRDLNNNPHEPYTPEMYVNEPLFHRGASSWQPAPTPQTLPNPLFSSGNPPTNETMNPSYSYDDRNNGPQRYERRKAHSYHPYHRNDYQDYPNNKQRNGNYNHSRRGGGGGGANYYR